MRRVRRSAADLWRYAKRTYSGTVTSSVTSTTPETPTETPSTPTYYILLENNSRLLAENNDMLRTE